MTASTDSSTNGPRPSAIDRALSIFAEVHPGEGIRVLLLFANIFLILTAYYVLKVVREALTLGGVELFGLGGDQIKAYLPAVMMVLLLGIVPAYGALVNSLSRIRLLNATMTFVIVTLVGFFFWGTASGVGTAIGLSFYIYLGIVNVFLIAQFWSFANDLHDEAQGKRLFAIIALGQSLGAVLGPRIAALGAGNVFALLLVSAGIFGLCILLYNVANRWAPAEDAPTKEETGEEEETTSSGGFKLVFQKRYLLLIALLILVSNVVNSTGEFILSNAATRYAAEAVPALGADQAAEVEALSSRLVADGEATDVLSAREAATKTLLKGARSSEIGRFYASFFFWVNLIGVLMQMFLVSRFMAIAGVRAGLFVLPLIVFGGYLAIALTGTLAVLRIAKTAENSVDYSLQNTIKQALFLPTTREEKYKAKAAIDTFFVRMGDTVSAVIVGVGVNVLGAGATEFAWLNVALVGLWLAIAFGIARAHRGLTGEDGAAAAT